MRNPLNATNTFSIVIIVCTTYESTIVEYGPTFSPYFYNDSYRVFHTLPNKNPVDRFKMGENVSVDDLTAMSWFGSVSIR
jgi:hypothetical protein